MPEYVYQAHEIEEAMNEKAGTRDLDDDDIADEVAELSSDEDAPAIPLPATKPRASSKKAIVKAEPNDIGPTARRTSSDRITQLPPRTSRTAGSTLLGHLSDALDPASQAARQEERSARTFQASQLFSVTAQLREPQSLVETLRTRLADSDRERHGAERRADKADMMAMFAGQQAAAAAAAAATAAAVVPQPPPAHPPRWSNVPSATRTPSRPVREDVYYAGGGHGVRWRGPDSSPQNDSPETRVYARYTPERVSFESRHTQSTPTIRESRQLRRTAQPYSPEPRVREPLAYFSRRQSPVPEAIASSSRHADCIQEALVPTVLHNDSDVFHADNQT